MSEGRLHPTYRDHAELTANAFQRLVVGAAVPTDPVDVGRLLACRDMIVSSLEERLGVLGLDPAQHSLRIVTQGRDKLNDLASNPRESVVRLAHVVMTLPRVPESERQSPIDVLEGGSSDATVNQWRAAAKYLVSATATLDESPDRPWESDDGAAWWLLRDVATLTEAVVVVDGQLDSLGLLDSLSHSPQADPRAVQRLIAAQCARESSWRSNSDAAELATRGEKWQIGAPRPVSQAADLPGAQKNLAGYLRVISRNNSASYGHPAISLSAAKAVTQVQQSGVRTALDWCKLLPDLKGMLPVLETAQANIDNVAKELRTVRERVTQMPSRAVMEQSKIISDGVKRMNISARLDRVPPTTQYELVHWIQAQHQTSTGLAVAVRRELNRKDSNLEYAVKSPHESARPTSKSPLGRAAQELAQLPAPALPVSRLIGPTQRVSLATTLRETPSADVSRARFPRHRPAKGIER